MSETKPLSESTPAGCRPTTGSPYRQSTFTELMLNVSVEKADESRLSLQGRKVLARIFTGTDSEEAAACRAELAALGDGPVGDRLRCLVERLVKLLQGEAYSHHGCLIRPNGEPLSNREIAQLALWDVTTIDADLRELARAGLLELVYRDTLPTVEEYHP